MMRAVPEDFVIARNPEAGSQLPYLLRVPLGGGVVLKARETWPRTQKVYCHRAEGWPAAPEVVERVPVKACRRRGAAIDLVLDRHRENRSQLVFTQLRGGREAIFWQTARTAKKARPRVRTATGRAAGLDDLRILVASDEKYPYRFTRQQTETVRQGLRVGDYAVLLDDEPVATVERKSLTDLSSSLLSGRLGFTLAELASLPRAAVVVEDRYSRLFALEHVRPSVIADALAEAQVRWPAVPIVFCETRQLAEEWTYRFLAAALAELSAGDATATLEGSLSAAPPLPPAPGERRGDAGVGARAGLRGLGPGATAGARGARVRGGAVLSATGDRRSEEPRPYWCVVTGPDQPVPPPGSRSSCVRGRTRAVTPLIAATTRKAVPRLERPARAPSATGPVTAPVPKTKRVPEKPVEGCSSNTAELHIDSTAAESMTTAP